MMRKLTATILGTAVLAGGALAGVAAAAPAHHEHARTEMQMRERSSVDRMQHAAGHERSDHRR